MKKLLLFGGTSEEHELLKALAIYPVEISICVASDYGRALLPQENDKLLVHVGRLDAKQMADMVQNKGFAITVDATHPYATEVTRNIKEAAFKTGIPYFRLLRDFSDIDSCLSVSSVLQAAQALEETSGNVLITTGGKELAAFTGVLGYQERLYPRVLPTLEAIQSCLTLGFSASHIIAMQGPFSKELNIALMRQFDMKTLVTKDGGKFGGFPEKLEAAKELDAKLIVIRRPDEEGLSCSEVVQKIAEILEEEQ